MVADLGVELTREHRLRQIRNAAAVAAMVVELCNRHRKGLYTDAELITALVGAEALGFESAVAMASEYMVEHRTLVARDLLDAPLVVPEFDAKAASARALSTLKAFHRLRAADLPQHVVDREFRAITGNLGVWANKATHMASRNLIVESAGYAGSRWRRVTDGNPCAFCAMLAARGPVYLTRESAGHVVGREMGRGTKHYRSTGKVSYGGPADRRRGTRDIGERYHDRCGCTVEEVTGDWSPTAEEQRFVNLYRDALERLQDQDQPASTTNILGAMREMGDGVIHDAHTPETETGGGSGGVRPPRRGQYPSDSGEPKRVREPRNRTKGDHDHWQARQDSLPFITRGAVMKPHEIEFAEAFLASGHTIVRWLPEGRFDPGTGRLLPESDFEWTAGKLAELKRTNNVQTMKDYIHKGLGQGKNVFIIDLGTYPPNSRIRNGITKQASSNATGEYEVWAFWDGGLERLR